jgi:hypothetical protein
MRCFLYDRFIAEYVLFLCYVRSLGTVVTHLKGEAGSTSVRGHHKYCTTVAAAQK